MKTAYCMYLNFPKREERRKVVLFLISPCVFIWKANVTCAVLVQELRFFEGIFVVYDKFPGLNKPIELYKGGIWDCEDTRSYFQVHNVLLDIRPRQRSSLLSFSLPEASCATYFFKISNFISLVQCLHISNISWKLKIIKLHRYSKDCLRIVMIMEFVYLWWELRV